MNTPCTTCHTPVPAAASFCPFCGDAAAAPFNNDLVSRLLREPNVSETMMMEPVEDFRPGRKHGLKLFVGVAVTSAVIAGIFVGNWLADIVFRPAELLPAVTMVVPDEEPAAPALAALVVSANETGGFDLTRGAEIIYTVKSADGSRYKTIDERMRSVAVRFNHISKKGEGRFAARLVGDHYELVWADRTGDFRLMDVTDQDAGSSTNADFTANYLADRLNADLPLPNNS